MKKISIIRPCVKYLAELLLLLLLHSSAAYSSTMLSADYAVELEVFSTIGDERQSANYSLWDTIGQSSPVRAASSAQYANSGGFWPTIIVASTIPADQHVLMVNKSGSGSGTISATGLSCSGTSCSGTYGASASVTLTATADTGSAFAGWSGSGCSGTGTCQITMNDNVTVIATFIQKVSCMSPLSTVTKSFACKGGPGSVQVTAKTKDCAWTAESNSDWIKIKSGSSGKGKKGSVVYTVSANTTTTSREGTLMVGGQTFTVKQSGAPCKYSIAPINKQFSNTDGTGSFDVTTADGCTWTATVDSKAGSWITIFSGSSGSGSGTVSYTVSGNLTKKARTGKINFIGGTTKKTFAVKQAR